MTKYSPTKIPATAAPQLAYKKRFFSTWARYTGNYFYGGNLVISDGKAVLFSSDTDGGTLQVTKFDWATGQTLAKFPQPYTLGEHGREIDSHHFTNPLVWHSDGRIYSRRGGDSRGMYALDPQSGAWTQIREVMPPETSAWGGDATAFIQTYRDWLIYRYGDPRGYGPYAAYDISAAAYTAGSVGTYKASLGHWVFPPSGTGYEHGDYPKVARNISVIAASIPGRVSLEAVNMTTGARWSKSLASDSGGELGSRTGVSDYWRFLATEDGHFAMFTRSGSPTLRVFDLATGREKWTSAFTNAAERPLLAYHAGALYAIGRAQQVKLNADTGAVLWQATGSFSNDTGYVHKNYEDGTLWTQDPVYRPVVLTDDTLWFVDGSAANSGVLVGLKTADGSVAHSIDLAALARVGTESMELVNDLVASQGKLGVLVNITDSADTHTPKNRYQDLYVYSFAPPSPRRR